MVPENPTGRPQGKFSLIYLLTFFQTSWIIGKLQKIYVWLLCSHTFFNLIPQKVLPHMMKWWRGVSEYQIFSFQSYLFYNWLLILLWQLAHKSCPMSESAPLSLVQTVIVHLSAGRSKFRGTLALNRLKFGQHRWKFGGHRWIFWRTFYLSNTSTIWNRRTQGTLMHLIEDMFLKSLWSFDSSRRVPPRWGWHVLHSSVFPLHSTLKQVEMLKFFCSLAPHRNGLEIWFEDALVQHIVTFSVVPPLSIYN